MRPDARRGQIQPERRAQSAGADQQHLGLLQLQLALHADFGHDQVAAVAQDLVVREGRSRRDAHADPPAMLGTIEIVSPSAHRRRVLAQIADVFVVQVDVDEAAQLAFVVVEMCLRRSAMLGGQRVEHLADGRPGELDGILLPGELAQRRRDQNLLWPCPV